MKEKTCYVALDLAAEKTKASSSTECQKVYELPDGQTVNINAPRFMGPEAIFNPALIKEGDETLGMAQMVVKSINECDLDVREDLWKNVILSGGTTLYEGLPDRMHKELDAKCPKAGTVEIIAGADRYYSVWSGGSTLSSLSTFEASWITKEEFEEHGAEIVHRKCV